MTTFAVMFAPSPDALARGVEPFHEELTPEHRGRAFSTALEMLRCHLGLPTISVAAIDRFSSNIFENIRSEEPIGVLTCVERREEARLAA